MKVEVISIGNELLLDDVLDTNAAYVVRCLREINVPITCRVTVGDDPALIADTLRTALLRADIVVTTGGVGSGPDDYTLQGVATVSEQLLMPSSPWISGGTVLEGSESNSSGLFLETESGTLFCLPGRHRDMVYLFETKVFPYLQERIPDERASGWLVLRTAGIMESNIRQQLSGLVQHAGERLSYNSYAGQTDIRITVEAGSQIVVEAALQRLSGAVKQRLGDHIYGQGQDRLEEVLLDQFRDLKISVAIAECGTGRALKRILEDLPEASQVFITLPVASREELGDYFELDPLTAESDLTQWCRFAAEAVRLRTGAELGLVLYNNFTQSGVQILVTLASPIGVTMMQRSFGGHPGNIDQWASTLGLVNLRRWLISHQMRQASELDLT